MPCLILEAKYFNAFLDGRKTVEGRPRNGKIGYKVKMFGEITAGDVLEVRAGQGCARQDDYHLQAGTCLFAEVVEVLSFPKWYHMLEYYGMKACLPDLDSDNLKDGVDVYKSISPAYKNAEREAGVLGIRLRVVCPQSTLQPALVFNITKRQRDTTDDEVRNIQSSVTKTKVIKNLANPRQLKVGVVTSDKLQLASDKVLSEGDLVLRIIDSNGKEYNWEDQPKDPSRWAKLKVWSHREDYARNQPKSETKKRIRTLYTDGSGLEDLYDTPYAKRRRSASCTPSSLRRTASSPYM
jgi:ASC-1-like (ASCH) protein